MSPASCHRPISPCICDCCGITIGAPGPGNDGTSVEDSKATLLAPTEDVPDHDEVRVEEEEEDSPAGVPRHAPCPGDPSQRQVEEHRRVHWPYRSWCKWCVLGRGRGTPHVTTGKSDIPVVGIDYFFITKGNAVENENSSTDAMEEKLDSGEAVKCLVVRCSHTKCVFAHVVPKKGIDGENIAVDMILNDLEWLGHTRIILKSDGEPAIRAVVRRTINLAKAECRDIQQISKEESASYDSQSNGSTEIGVRIIRGMFRTIKLCLEDRIDKAIPFDHALTSWMIEHASLVVNAMSKGEDGITPWHRARGRPFRQPLLGFGESVLYKFPPKGPRHAPEGNMGPLGAEGIFLGLHRSTNSYLVATNDGGCVHARSVTRRPEQDRWDAQALADVCQLPRDSRDRGEAARRPFDGPSEDRGPTAESTRPAPVRRMRINKSDLVRYGFHRDCPQCEHIQKYGHAQPGRPHTDACRKQLEEAMAETEDGRERLKAYEESLTRSMAEHVERSDEQASRHQAPKTAKKGLLERRAPEPPIDSQTAPAGTSVEDARGERHGPHPLDASIPQPSEPPAREVSDPSVEERSVPKPRAPAVSYDFDRGDGVMEEDPEEHEGDVEMEFCGELNLMEEVGSLEPSFNDSVSELLLNQLGSVGKSFRREARSAGKKIVSEIYSPPRVTDLIKRIRSRHLLPGLALDLTVVDPEDGLPWDFSIRAKRERARKLIREQKPYVLIGSPECTPFSTWQYINRAKHSNPVHMDRAKTAAEVHIRFVCELYQEQIDGGRYFLHEHPMWATSWSMKCVQSILEQEEVQKVRCDQCMYGAATKQRSGTTGVDARDGTGTTGVDAQPIMKPTGFMTNSPRVAAALSGRCTGKDGHCSRPTGGKHVTCSGRHARASAIYPKGLCKAILKGIRDQLKADDLIKSGCFGVQAPDDDAEVERQMRGPAQGYSGKYRDDLTGQVLKDELVEKARAVELAYFHSKSVWVKVPKQDARRTSGKTPISVRWVDVNKGDDLNPNYRSRLVARQIKALDRSGDSFFAPAPPLEALRTVLSLAMTKVGPHCPDWDPASPNRTQISLIDIKRAYFNAKIDARDPPTYVQLPREDPDSDDMVGKLMRHMYGTRMAADGWQEEYSTFLVDLGFRQGDACPNLFHHAER